MGFKPGADGRHRRNHGAIVATLKFNSLLLLPNTQSKNRSTVLVLVVHSGHNLI